jgi:hypothetical protein
MMRAFLAVMVVVLLVGQVPAVQAEPIGIFSEIAGHPTAKVPGLPEGSFFDEFDRPYRSPDGSMWIMTAFVDSGSSSDDEFIIMGSGPTSTGAQVLIREGDQAPWAPAGYTLGLFDRNIGINDAGQFAFANNLAGDAPTGEDEQIIMWDGANFLPVAVEGGAVPGFAGEVWGTALDSATMTADGTVGFRATATVGGLPSTDDNFLFNGSAVVAQSNVTVPNGVSDPWQNFDLQDYYWSTDGAHYIVQGDTDAATGVDDIVVVDGNVVILEDTALPGFVSPVDNVVDVVMETGGDWFARGDNVDDQDWVLMNGDVIAQTGDVIPGGLPGEVFDDAPFSACFFSMVGNDVGDFVIGGTTSNPDADADAVLVYNNAMVLLRQGDAVDLDGNGLLDDGVFLNVFNNDDAFLTNDGWYYFTATLWDADKNDLGQAYMAIQVPEPTSLLLLVVGAAGLARRRR